jgi:hypothetical protein
MGALHCEQTVSIVHPQFSLRQTIALPVEFLAYGGPERTRTGAAARRGRGNIQPCTDPPRRGGQ